jgi:hypothetical protein
MRFGGSIGAAVYSDIGLNLAAGAFLGGGVFAPAYMGGGDNPLGSPFAPGHNPSGLLEAVGPAGYGRPYSAIRATGSSPGMNFHVRLAPGGVWGGPSTGGWTVTIDFVITRNGTTLYYQSLTSPPATGFALAFFPNEMDYTVVLPVSAGDEFRCGMIPHTQPLIYAYSSGTGQGTGMRMWGDLTPPGEEPSFAMRGSAVVA